MAIQVRVRCQGVKAFLADESVDKTLRDAVATMIAAANAPEGTRQAAVGFLLHELEHILQDMVGSSMPMVPVNGRGNA